MDEYEELLARLREMTEAQAQEFGKRAGVPWGTLLKIKYGQTKNPGILTIKKLVAQMKKGGEVRPANARGRIDCQPA